MTGFNNFKVVTNKNLYTWLDSIGHSDIISSAAAENTRTVRKKDIVNGDAATYSPNEGVAGIYISGYSVGDGKQGYTDTQNVIVQDIEYREPSQQQECIQYSYTGQVSNLSVPTGLACSDFLTNNGSSVVGNITFDCTISRNNVEITPSSSDFVISFASVDSTHVSITIKYRGYVSSCSQSKSDTTIYTGTIECTSGSQGGDEPVVEPEDPVIVQPTGDICQALAATGATVEIVTQNLTAYCTDISLATVNNGVDGDIAILVKSSYYAAGAKTTTALTEGFMIILEEAPANFENASQPVTQNGYIYKQCNGQTYQFPFTYSRIPCNPVYVKTIPCIKHGITPQRGRDYFVYNNGVIDNVITAGSVASGSYYTITATDGTNTASSYLSICPYFTMSYNTTDFQGTSYTFGQNEITSISGPAVDPSYGDTLEFVVTPTNQGCRLKSIEVEVLGEYNLGTNNAHATFTPTVLPNGTSVVFVGTEQAAGAATISVSGSLDSATVTISNVTGNVRILAKAELNSTSANPDCIYYADITDVSTNQVISTFRIIDNYYQTGYETVDNGYVMVNGTKYLLLGDYYSFSGMQCGDTKHINAIQDCDIETNIYYGQTKEYSEEISIDDLIDGQFTMYPPTGSGNCSITYTNPNATVDSGQMSAQYDDTEFAYSSYSNGFTGLKISPSSITCGQPLNIYLNMSYDSMEYVIDTYSNMGQIPVGSTTKTFTVSSGCTVNSVTQNNEACQFTQTGNSVSVTLNTAAACSDSFNVNMLCESSTCYPQQGYPKVWYDQSSVTPVKVHENLTVTNGEVQLTYNDDVYFTATQHNHTLYEDNCDEEVNSTNTVQISGATKKSTSVDGNTVTAVFGITGKWSENGEPQEKTFTVTFGVAQ